MLARLLSLSDEEDEPQPPRTTVKPVTQEDIDKFLAQPLRKRTITRHRLLSEGFDDDLPKEANPNLTQSSAASSKQSKPR
jgi:hypothetical protein